MRFAFLLALALTLGTSSQATIRSAPSGWTISRAGHGLARQETPDTGSTLWVLVPEESEARYRVTEQLAGLDFPSDAVGTTKELSGRISLAEDGTILAEASEFRVQLAALTTDNERRDGYVGRRTLEVAEFPEAVLVPRRFLGLSAPVPQTGSVSFRLEADLTLHGVTRPTVWEVTATFTPTSISGLAKTSFTFQTFDIAKPSVARVLGVEDDIRLELDFQMVQEDG